MTTPSRTLTLLAALLSTGVCATAQAGVIYWSHSTGDSINKVNFSGGSPGVLFNPALNTPDPDGPQGVAVDPIANKVYWADYNTDTIRRGNTDGTNMEVLPITASNSLDAQDIALDVRNGKVYWASDDGFIGRSNLDGSSSAKIVTNASVYSQGLDVDPIGGKIYWSNHVGKEIWTANLDGSSQAILYDGVGVPNNILASNRPLFIALDLVNQSIYIVTDSANDFVGDAIYRAAMDGSSTSLTPVMTASVGAIRQLAVDPFGDDLYFITTGAGNEAIRSKDLTTAAGDAPGTVTTTSGNSPVGLDIDVLQYAVPEPASLTLLGTTGLLLLPRRKR